MKTFRKPIQDRPHGWLTATLLLALCGPLWAVDLDPQRVGQWPGGPQGSAHAVEVAGQYAFVLIEGAGGGLQVIDISDPANPRRVGGYAMTSYPNGIAVAGEHAYVADGSVGLQVIDVTNPAEPQRIGNCDLGWKESVQVAVSGKYAYVAGSSNRIVTLHIIDITDPAHPLEAGRCETRGYLQAVAVSGHHAYVVAWGADPQVIDITDPAHPRRVGGLEVCLQEGSVGVAVSGEYAYLAGWWCDQAADTWRDGLKVIDTSNPASPQEVGRLDGVSGRVVVSGSHAFAHGSHGGVVVDITDPAHPQRVGYCGTSGWVGGAAFSGNKLYLATSGDGQAFLLGEGLLVFDISVLANPQRVGTHPTSGTASRLAVSGNYAYVVENPPGGGANQLLLVDISSPAHPQPVGRWSGTGWIEDVAVSGNYAYVARSGYNGANWIAGLQVIDISDPSNPRLSGAYGTGGSESSGVAGVAVSGNHAYVTGNHGLLVIDVSDPAHPRPVGTYGGSFRAVVVSGNYAYLSRGGLLGRQVLEVIDISDPTNPQRVGGNSLCAASDLAVAGNLVYAAGEDGLVILNTYQPPPRIESAQFGNDGFRLVFRGEVGRTIRLQRSPDLKTWEDWVILTATGDSQAVADPSADLHPCQFYRAVGQ